MPSGVFKRKPTKRKCVVCNKDFYGIGNSKYCNNCINGAYNEKDRKRWNRHYKKRPKRIVFCDYCNREFKTHRYNTRFCSPKCKISFYNNEYKKKYKDSPEMYREETLKRLHYIKRIDPRILLLKGAKQRAKKNNLDFNLELDDIVYGERCPVLGMKFNFMNTGYPKDNSPSLDKIIPKKGYVKGNVAVISFKANSIKRNATLEELEKMTKWLKQQLRSKKK